MQNVAPKLQVRQNKGEFCTRVMETIHINMARKLLLSDIQLSENYEVASVFCDILSVVSTKISQQLFKMPTCTSREQRNCWRRPLACPLKREHPLLPVVNIHFHGTLSTNCFHLHHRYSHLFRLLALIKQTKFRE